MAGLAKKPLVIAAGITTGVVAVAGAAMALIGNAGVDYALVPGKDGKTSRMHTPDRIGGDLANGSVGEGIRSVVEENSAAAHRERDAWLATIEVECVHIPAAGGAFDLAGFIYPAAIPSNNWAFLVHGYSGTHTEIELIATRYAQAGYNVFAPDLRAQGESGGDFIGMGWTDRLDILRWLDYLIGRYGTDVDIVLHGHSMGGATVCMVSGEVLPAQVKAVISDCAYTSVWDMFSGQVKKLFGIPPYPLLTSARIMLKARGGYDIKQASAVAQVKKSSTPTLFIHGASDGFVPPAMVHVLFEACNAHEKRLLIVAGAGHALSAQTDPGLYYTTVFDFLGNKMG